MSNHNIKIFPHGLNIQIADGNRLLDSLIEHSVFLRSDCGGKGVCGKCLIKIKHCDGTLKTTEACQVTVSEDLSIEIPVASLLSSHIIEKAPANFPPSFSQSFNKTKQHRSSYGIAVDIGTTTVALYLCNMNSGKVLSSVSVGNPQTIFGDDVMSRVGMIAKGRDNLLKLQTLIIKTVEWGCQRLARFQKIKVSSIEKIVAVGNPAMIHLFLGVDPSSISVAPYRPAFFEARCVQGIKLGFEELACPVHTLPQISGFLGGDILAAAIAAELGQRQTGTLLIDIGTNGELIYKGKNGFYATSCATGPAFEGATLFCGMHAIPGAIDKIILAEATELPEYRVIQSSNKKRSPLPAGLCGSGVISATAALYRTGIIDSGGAMAVNENIVSLQKEDSGTKKYVIAAIVEGKAGQNKEVFIDQKDIRSIQLGKAALITGIEFLLKMEEEVSPDNIVVGGAFGSYLDKKDMMTLGMIPQVPEEKIEIAGNLAGAGAVMALCNKRYQKLAQKMADEIEVVDLAKNIDFQQSFIANLRFPGLL